MASKKSSTEPLPKTQKLRDYETVLITKIDMPDDKFTQMIERCQQALTEVKGGKWELQDDWGKAKIAFPIQKDNRGRWTFFRFRSTGEGIKEMQRSLKINEYVLRQMTVLVDEGDKSYETLRENMAKELADRDRPRDWREERGERGDFRRSGPGGGRRDFDGGGGYRSGERPSYRQDRDDDSSGAGYGDSGERN